MKHILKSTLTFAAVAITALAVLSATACKKGDGTETETPVNTPKFALNFESEYEGGTVSVTVGGQTVASGTELEANTPVTITADAADGHLFERWSGIAVADNTLASLTFPMPARETTVTATFRPEVVVPTAYPVNFTASPAGGGVTVQVNGQPIMTGAMVDIDTEVTITANPLNDYTFGGWGGVTLDDNMALTATFRMPAEAITITAVFRGIQYYSITFAGYGHVEGSGNIRVYVDGSAEHIANNATVREGQSINVKAVPLAGWRFVSMTFTGVTLPDGDLGKDDVTFLMPSSNISIRAVFEVIPTPDAIQVGSRYWATRNVAASKEFAENPESAGLLYQFNAGNVGWDGTTPTPSNGTWRALSGWGAPSPNMTAWNSHPCPAGYRLPTEADFAALVTAATSMEEKTIGGMNGRALTVENGELFFPYAGVNTTGVAAVVTPGSEGWYWTSEAANSGTLPDPPLAKLRKANGSNFPAANEPRQTAASVRCVK